MGGNLPKVRNLRKVFRILDIAFSIKTQHPIPIITGWDVVGEAIENC